MSPLLVTPGASGSDEKGQDDLRDMVYRHNRFGRVGCGRRLIPWRPRAE